MCSTVCTWERVQVRYDKNGRSQMQGSKNWIYRKWYMQTILLRLYLAGNLETPLMSLYGTEWRERGYELWMRRSGRMKSVVIVVLMLLHKHKFFFEECVREETAYLATFKSKSIWVDNVFIETSEIETGIAEKSSWNQANRRQKPGLVWRNRKKISQIIKDYFYLPFFLLIILCIEGYCFLLGFLLLMHF